MFVPLRSGKTLAGVQTGMILYKINRAYGLHPLRCWQGIADAVARDYLLR
jgi:hypothetical protein